jgi:hypothetical protein
MSKRHPSNKVFGAMNRYRDVAWLSRGMDNSAQPRKTRKAEEMNRALSGFRDYLGRHLTEAEYVAASLGTGLSEAGRRAEWAELRLMADNFQEWLRQRRLNDKFSMR